MSIKLRAIDTTTAGQSFETTAPVAADIADASVAHALNSTFSDTEVETALNALGTTINLILDVLDANGLTA